MDPTPSITPAKEPRYRHMIIAAGCLMIVALVVGLYTASSSQRQIYLVNHTHRVLSNIHETGALLRNTESEQRGFLITGSPGYETRAEHYAQQLGESLAHLITRVHDNEDQLQRAQQLRDAIGNRMDALRSNALVTTKSSIAEVKDILGDEAQERVMSRIRELQTAMIAEEEALLADRRKNMEGEIRFATITILFSGGIALLLGIMAFVVMRRSLDALNREAELLRQKETAETADREKSEFLANMSHEIRTPMNSVLGFAELLAGTVTTPKQEQYVAAINSSGRAMLSLINDILDLSKIEAGVIALNYQPIELSALFEEIKEIFAPQAEARGLKFEISVSERIPAAVEFDQTRLRQILFNVVGNSLKFTRSGSIKISADAEIDPQQATEMRLRISIADTGIGISEEFQEKVFEPFRQVESSSVKTHGGTGLGLSITQRLTALLKGTVDLQSKENEGTTLTFVFPHVRISTTRPATEQPLQEGEDFDRLRPSVILVADDAPLNLDLIANHFENTSHRLVFARNGIEALAQARRHQPDLALLDIRMPDMDGRTTLQHMRDDSGLKDIPVISVTASSMKTEEIELRKVFDGHLRKPYTRESLFREVAQHIPLNQTAEVGEDDPPGVGSASGSAGNATEPNEKWPELVEQLRQLELDPYPTLRRSMSTRDLTTFARKIRRLGEAAACPEAVSWGGKLEQQVETFQISAMEASMRRFPQLVAGIADRTSPTR